MYIAPNSTIKMLKDVPLDTTYNHTIYFANSALQASYFMGLQKYSFNDQTYQRVNRGVLRIRRSADDLYDCNYLMFQNTAFGTKWFYAFVKSVEYVNNVTSEITYEIDVMQTWHFDYTLGECFVDREHAAQDGIDQNTVPENIETGPYVSTNSANFLSAHFGICLMATEISPSAAGEIAWNEPQVIGGFPMPCYIAYFGNIENVTMEYIQRILDAFSADGKIDAIVGMFTYPVSFSAYGENPGYRVVVGAERNIGYVPRNKKLLTYPYCALEVTALGQSCELRYDLFSTTDQQFSIRYGFGPNMEVAFTPLNYAGKQENFEYTVTIKDFPICAWIKDYYQNWLAQNKARITIGTISAVANAVTGVVGAGSSIGAGNSILSSITSVATQMSEVYRNKMVPDQMVGSASAGDIFAMSGVTGFYTSCKCITGEYQAIIDEYFDMFGYKTNRVKVPNRNVRPFWTYTKTVGCVAKGSVPADDMRQICAIYDKGITFWTQGDNVGNYSLDNRVG